MDMRFRTPTTARGWLSLGVILVALLLGIWPVISLFNRNVLVLGLPLLLVWTVAMLGITTIAMILVNRITGDMGDVDPLDLPQDPSADRAQGPHDEAGEQP